MKIKGSCILLIISLAVCKNCFANENWDMICKLDADIVRGKIKYKRTSLSIDRESRMVANTIYDSSGKFRRELILESNVNKVKQINTVYDGQDWFQIIGNGSASHD
ncbi:hypothetical protein [Abditibacterium utsteinense]|nr:hypothetical protein [Abditibacterium utsteinense]